MINTVFMSYQAREGNDVSRYASIKFKEKQRKHYGTLTIIVWSRTCLFP